MTEVAVTWGRASGGESGGGDGTLRLATKNSLWSGLYRVSSNRCLCPPPSSSPLPNTDPPRPANHVINIYL